MKHLGVMSKRTEYSMNINIHYAISNTVIHNCGTFFYWSRLVKNHVRRLFVSMFCLILESCIYEKFRNRRCKRLEIESSRKKATHFITFRKYFVYERTVLWTKLRMFRVGDRASKYEINVRNYTRRNILEHERRQGRKEEARENVFDLSSSFFITLEHTTKAVY